MEPLLHQVAQGDSDAVRACLDQYGNLVWSMALRNCPDRSEAEDAVQEIFIDLWKSAGRFDPSRSSESTFVGMIARRRLIDRRRSRARRPFTEGLDERLEARGLEPVSNEGPDALEATADASLAARALARLDPKERHVVLLSAYHGYSHGQIAKETGIPLGTVKTYVRRGLSRVREMLESTHPLPSQEVVT